MHCTLLFEAYCCKERIPVMFVESHFIKNIHSSIKAYMRDACTILLKLRFYSLTQGPVSLEVNVRPNRKIFPLGMLKY